jgi:hypothetical protein
MRYRSHINNTQDIDSKAFNPGLKREKKHSGSVSGCQRNDTGSNLFQSNFELHQHRFALRHGSGSSFGRGVQVRY